MLFKIYKNDNSEHPIIKVDSFNHIIDIDFKAILEVIKESNFTVQSTIMNHLDELSRIMKEYEHPTPGKIIHDSITQVVDKFNKYYGWEIEKTLSLKEFQYKSDFLIPFHFSHEKINEENIFDCMWTPEKFNLLVLNDIIQPDWYVYTICTDEENSLNSYISEGNFVVNREGYLVNKKKVVLDGNSVEID